MRKIMNAKQVKKLRRAIFKLGPRLNKLSWTGKRIEYTKASPKKLYRKCKKAYKLYGNNGIAAILVNV